MDNQVVTLREVKEKSKTSFILSIVGMSLAAAYLLEGLSSVSVSVVTSGLLALLGIIIGLFLFIAEIALMVGMFVVNGISLYKALRLKKVIALLDASEAKEKVASQNKLAVIFSVIGLSCSAGFVVVVSILNCAESLLMWL